MWHMTYSGPEWHGDGGHRVITESVLVRFRPLAGPSDAAGVLIVPCGGTTTAMVTTLLPTDSSRPLTPVVRQLNKTRHV